MEYPVVATSEHSFHARPEAVEASSRTRSGKLAAKDSVPG
jgi:hypothetical protein